MSNVTRYNRAKGRNSFLMYDDFADVLEDLTDEEAGIIFREIYKYRLYLKNQDTTEEPPELKDRMLRMVLSPVKGNLRRDWDAYVEACAKKKNNDSKEESEEPENHRMASHNRPYAMNSEDKVTYARDNDNDTDTVNGTDNDNGNESVNGTVNKNESVSESVNTPHSVSGEKEDNKHTDDSYNFVFSDPPTHTEIKQYLQQYVFYSDEYWFGFDAKNQADIFMKLNNEKYHWNWLGKKSVHDVIEEFIGHDGRMSKLRAGYVPKEDPKVEHENQIQKIMESPNFQEARRMYTEMHEEATAGMSNRDIAENYLLSQYDGLSDTGMVQLAEEYHQWTQDRDRLIYQQEMMLKAEPEPVPLGIQRYYQGEPEGFDELPFN